MAPMVVDTAWVLLGLVTVVAGADVFVRGASRLADLWGMSPLWVGLTVVAVGTSAPEVALSVKAMLEGRVDMAIGNVVGSNIFNILVVLGACGLVAPLPAQPILARVDLPGLLAASVLSSAFVFVGQDLGRWEGFFLLAGLLSYVAVRAFSDRSNPEKPRRLPFSWVQLLWGLAGIGLGLVCLRYGSEWMIDGSVGLASRWGVSERVIALTILSTGTSLPEVATSLVAVARGEKDLAVGNAVGSCLMNLLLVLGLTASFAPSPLQVNPSTLTMDLPVMLATVVACMGLFRPGRSFGRLPAGLFLAGYVAYLGWILAG